MAWQVKNPTSIQENAGLIPGLAQWVKDPVEVAQIHCCCGCGMGPRKKKRNKTKKVKQNR